MKKIILALLLVTMTLLSACKGDKKGAALQQNEVTEPQTDESTNDIEDEEDELESIDIESEEDELESLPIDIEYVSYDVPISWDDTIYEHDQYSVSYPENWEVIDGKDHGLVDGVFFVPPEADINNFRYDCHIAIEAISADPNEQNYDFSKLSTQKDFFATMIVSTYSKMGGLSDLEFSVWQNEDDFIYITDYTRSNSTLTMYQTTYYVMGKDKDYVIYATTFGEDAAIPVQEAARHLITSLQSN